MVILLYNLYLMRIYFKVWCIQNRVIMKSVLKRFESNLKFYQLISHIKLKTMPMKLHQCWRYRANH